MHFPCALLTRLFLFGAVQFHDEARAAGIKPIIGCEVYVARDGRHTKSGRSDRSNHLVLLAKDDIGYRNLIRLVSLGYQEGFYYRPRVDKILLKQYNEGIIATSACLIYSGDEFPEWKGQAMIASLKHQSLRRLNFEENKFIEEEILFKNTIGRIRDVKQDLNGKILMLSDYGEIWRMSKD